MVTGDINWKGSHCAGRLFIGNMGVNVFFFCFFFFWGGGGGVWCSKEARGAYGVSLWKFIRKEWESFVKHVNFVVGEGSRISFWFDDWCGDRALNRVFPAIFCMASDWHTFVSDLLVRTYRSLQWDVRFNRTVQDWELDDVSDFFGFLYSLGIGGDERDRIL
ncbi:hypothetical protein I3842_01G085400 [Carya illinoinensis]|uniref:Reverse transcriptase zinc-binding domain-containing protein n=1 Tax=Carya illinoinensis TaxID=32201 RepID=A0A922K2R3_CARIL|nr:hypothetical protein I3842_01G085400 [Carya illinoinensis]